ncbi:hypothetical protein K9N50_11425 [bacterium]|nr:hypothetical protein [bacterium]
MKITAQKKEGTGLYTVTVDGVEVGLGDEKECTALAEELRENLDKVNLIYDSFVLCDWTEDVDSGAWETACGNIFELTEGTPLENGMEYCAYCGKKLREAKRRV